MVQAKPGSGTTGWFIGLIVAIAFLVLILILICIVKRNRGGKYAVYEREIAHGHLDYAEGGFREYSQPYVVKFLIYGFCICIYTFQIKFNTPKSGCRVEERSGRMSMASDFKPPHESDTDSMGDYGDEGKANYVRSKKDKTSQESVLKLLFVFVTAKFAEDGSFIGQYGNKKKPDPNLPSPMATFV